MRATDLGGPLRFVVFDTTIAVLFCDTPVYSICLRLQAAANMGRQRDDMWLNTSHMSMTSTADCIHGFQCAGQKATHRKGGGRDALCPTVSFEALTTLKRPPTLLCASSRPQ
jgi:hypothetical protein